MDVTGLFKPLEFAKVSEPSQSDVPNVIIKQVLVY